MDRENRRSIHRTDIDISTLSFFGFQAQDGLSLEYFLIKLLVNINTVSLLWLGYFAYMYQNATCPA